VKLTAGARALIDVSGPSCGGGTPKPPSISPPSTSPPCADGQMHVINNCGGVIIRHCDGFNSKTIASGTCQDLRNGKRLWAGPYNTVTVPLRASVTLNSPTRPFHVVLPGM